jgi:2-amino-4-hydroxy-6-hydroxymethyldihydropteridine diphosphokinase
VNPVNHQACLLLGSNIRAEENLGRAIQLVQKKTELIHVSSVWETASIGSDAPNFLNLALLVLTPLDTEELKTKVLRPLEAEMGRVRSADKNAPRPIDLDIIIFDGKVVDELLWKHAYRAAPAAELLPDLRSASGELLGQAALRLAAEEVVFRREDLSYAFR